MGHTQWMDSAPARAVLLAAGRGQRLGALGADKPKCLLEFEGTSLLQRHLRTLAARGVAELFVVTGYRYPDVVAELERGSPLTVHRLMNLDFDQGSVMSLWRARDQLRRGGEVLLMDADVLYAPEVLDPLIRVRGTGLLMDRACDPDDPEPVKVCVREGRVVELSKTLAPTLRYDHLGESVGFFRLSEGSARALADEVDRRVDQTRLDEPYEAALREVLLEAAEPCRVHDVSGLPWIEIDFAEDVERARHEIMPRLGESTLRQSGLPGR